MAVCSILHPMEQVRAWTAPIVEQLHWGVLRKNPLTRIWAETRDMRKVIDLLHSVGKPSSLSLTLIIVIILALAMVKRLSDLKLTKITPWDMQVHLDSITFHTLFGAKITKPSHLYGPVITLIWSEDECFCPVGLVKKYLDITKINSKKVINCSLQGKLVWWMLLLMSQLPLGSKRDLEPGHHYSLRAFNQKGHILWCQPGGLLYPFNTDVNVII